MKKYIAVLFLLIASVSVHAQTEGFAYNLKVGDKVYISRECKTYLTGEAIPAWVYDSVLTVQQVGGKTYPNGVLLLEITSWVLPESLGATRFEEPVVAPEPEPVVVPEPEPEPEPAVVPEPEPVSEPEPVVVPEPEPVVVPEPEPEPVDTVVDRFVQHHRLGIGLKGGIASLRASVDGRNVKGFKTTPGAEYSMDLEYVYYADPLKDGRYQLGIKTGVSLSFTSNKASANAICSSYHVEDDGEGHAMTYTVAASHVREKDIHMMIDVPVMFTLHGKNGLTFSVGPRFAIPVLGRYGITFDNAVIDAYYDDFGVHEINEPVTGLVTEKSKIGDPTLIAPTIDFQLASELGYEWALKNGDALGLMGYVSFSAFYMNLKTASFPHMLQVDYPQAGGATVDIHSMINSYGMVNGYLNGGIKLCYSFCFLPKHKK